MSARRRKVKASEARQQLSGLLNEVYAGQTRVVIERSGIPVAAVISPEDLAHLERSEAEREARLSLLAKLREPFKEAPEEEIEREVAQAVAEVRAEMRERGSAPAVDTSADSDAPVSETRQLTETEGVDAQTTTVAEIREKILPVLQRHGITRAGLFGSVVRGEAGPESDVDILVEMYERASLLDFIGVKLDLQDVLGRPVDLVQYDAIKPALHDRILGEEVRIT